MKRLQNTLLDRMIKCMKSKFQNKPCSVRNELFIAGMTRSQIFNQMSLQDRILSLAKFVAMFHRDHGYLPERLTTILVKLNAELNANVLAEITSQV